MELPVNTTDGAVAVAAVLYTIGKVSEIVRDVQGKARRDQDGGVATARCLELQNRVQTLEREISAERAARHSLADNINSTVLKMVGQVAGLEATVNRLGEDIKTLILRSNHGN